MQVIKTLQSCKHRHLTLGQLNPSYNHQSPPPPPTAHFKINCHMKREPGVGKANIPFMKSQPNQLPAHSAVPREHVCPRVSSLPRILYHTFLEKHVYRPKSELCSVHTRCTELPKDLFCHHTYSTYLSRPQINKNKASCKRKYFSE